MQGVTNSALNAARAHLDAKGIENERTQADTLAKFGELKKSLAEARKTNAEAEEVEIRNRIARMKERLMYAKFVILGDRSEESIAFGQDVSELLAAVRAIEQDSRLLTDGRSGG